MGLEAEAGEERGQGQGQGREGDTELQGAATGCPGCAQRAKEVSETIHNPK